MLKWDGNNVGRGGYGRCNFFTRGLPVSRGREGVSKGFQCNFSEQFSVFRPTEGSFQFRCGSGNIVMVPRFYDIVKITGRSHVVGRGVKDSDVWGLFRLRVVMVACPLWEGTLIVGLARASRASFVWQGEVFYRVDLRNGIW